MHYYVRYYIDYARKNLPIVDDRKSICIKIRGPIADTVATYIGEKKNHSFPSAIECKNKKNPRKERKEKRRGGKRGKKSEDVDDNLISEIIAIVTDRAICNLRYVMLASYRRRKRIVGN